jgi:hypothetical protein|eukprot:COSAG01_NODE_8093_length_2924_cov_4.376991_5_plen_66_part_00
MSGALLTSCLDEERAEDYAEGLARKQCEVGGERLKIERVETLLHVYEILRSNFKMRTSYQSNDKP